MNGVDPVPSVPLSDVAGKRLAANTKVRTSGTVTQAVGVYAERTALLSDGDATIEVVLPAGATDVLQVVGQRVTVLGAVSSADVPRIRVAAAGDVQEDGQEAVHVQRIDAETTFSLLKTVTFSGTIEFVDRQRFLRVAGQLIRLSIPQELRLPLSAGTVLHGVGVVTEVDSPVVRLLSGSVEEVEEAAVGEATQEAGRMEQGALSVVDDMGPERSVEAGKSGIDSQVGAAASSLLSLAGLVEEQREQLNAVEFHAATESRQGSAVTFSLLFAMLSTALIALMGAEWIWAALVTTSLTEQDSAR
ncbi:MAG: hypothetical protein ACOYBJ_02310 [Patescibacteria group bacterium]|jgi:hypothetical protein